MSAGLSAAGDYADVRLATFDKNLFAVAGGDNETINGGVTALSVYDAGYGDERDVSGLSSPVALTLQVAQPYNTSRPVAPAQVLHGRRGVSFECPLGRETYACPDPSTFTGWLSVDATCPGVVPECRWWDWDALRWRS